MYAVGKFEIFWQILYKKVDHTKRNSYVIKSCQNKLLEVKWGHKGWNGLVWTGQTPHSGHDTWMFYCLWLMMFLQKDMSYTGNKASGLHLS